jgi:hypothetical protein
MFTRAASFLLVLCCCGPTPVSGQFDVLPVMKTPCGVAAVAPVGLRQGEVTTISLEPSRSDVALSLHLVPDDVEADLQETRLTLRAGYRGAGASVLAVRMECEGAQSLIEVPLRVEPRLRWGAPLTWTVGPTEREHPALLIDPASPDVLWLYGGFGFVPRQFTVMNDLWRLDLRTNTWAEVPTEQAPLVAGGRLAVTKTPGVFLLFSGQDPADEISTAVFQLDTRSTPVRFSVLQVAAPHGSTLNAFVFDAPRDRWVAFGGFTGVDPSNAAHTLTLSGAPGWMAARVTGQAPSARYGFFSALDGDRLLVASGAQRPLAGNPINPAKDTWALDLSRLEWTRVEAGGAEAPARRNGCGGFDPTTRRLFAWGGTANGATAVDALSVLTLEGSGGRWQTATPQGRAPVRASCSGVFDAARRRVLLGFGNTSSARYADLQVLELLDGP